MNTHLVQPSEKAVATSEMKLEACWENPKQHELQTHLAHEIHGRQSRMAAKEFMTSGAMQFGVK